MWSSSTLPTSLMTRASISGERRRRQRPSPLPCMKVATRLSSFDLKRGTAWSGTECFRQNRSQIWRLKDTGKARLERGGRQPYSEELTGPDLEQVRDFE